MNIRLAAGRVFDDRDGADAPRVAIVDEQAAAKYWPGRSAIGDRVNIDDDTNKTWRVIVAIVATVHHEALDGSRAARCTCRSIRPHRYLPSSTPTAMRWLLPPIRAAVVAIDPALPIYDVRPLDSRLAASLGRRRAATWLVGRLAALAVVLVSSVCTE